MKKAVLFDVDGTLCDVSPIRHHVRGGRGKYKDFVKFHAESVNCLPHESVVRAAQAAERDGLVVITVTARMAMWGRHTAMWMALHDIPSHIMFMRRNGDHRPDTEVKQDILNRIRCEFDVVHAWDDNPKIIALWEANGISTTTVEGWEQE